MQSRNYSETKERWEKTMYRNIRFHPETQLGGRITDPNTLLVLLGSMCSVS